MLADNSCRDNTLNHDSAFILLHSTEGWHGGFHISRAAMRARNMKTPMTGPRQANTALQHRHRKLEPRLANHDRAPTSEYRFINYNNYR